MYRRQSLVLRCDPGVKVNKITNLSDDIKLSLARKIFVLKHRFQGRVDWN